MDEVFTLMNDDEKIGQLAFIADEFEKAEVISSLTNDDKKIELLDTINDDDNKVKIISSIVNDEIRTELFAKINNKGINDIEIPSSLDGIDIEIPGIDELDLDNIEIPDIVDELNLGNIEIPDLDTGLNLDDIKIPSFNEIEGGMINEEKELNIDDINIEMPNFDEIENNSDISMNFENEEVQELEIEDELKNEEVQELEIEDELKNEEIQELEIEDVLVNEEVQELDFTNEEEFAESYETEDKNLEGMENNMGEKHGMIELENMSIEELRDETSKLSNQIENMTREIKEKLMSTIRSQREQKEKLEVQLEEVKKL